MKPNAYERYIAQVREKHRVCTPYRLGFFIGLAGDSLPSPYPAGTRGHRNYVEGVEYGRLERRIDAKAHEIYRREAPPHAPAWRTLDGAQKWKWREKAISEIE